MATLRNRHVLVTGGGSGIGRATALEAAARGADVTVVDIDGAAAREVADRIGGRAMTCDVSDRVAVDALAAGVPPVDILVNNAGVAVVAPFVETPPADWAWAFGVNVWGPVHVTRAFLPAMLARKRGHVVVVASVAGLVSAPGMVAYSTTKFAAVGFAEALRVEVEPHGIDVSVVCPGYVKTNLHRATRYANDAFRRFLDDPPRFYGMTDRAVGRAIANAVESRRDLVVLGPEKFGWWLKRLFPWAAHAMTKLVARWTGIDRTKGDERCMPS